MADKSEKPAIRFAGFTDAWEQRKLGELVDRVVRKNRQPYKSFRRCGTVRHDLTQHVMVVRVRQTGKHLGRCRRITCRSPPNSPFRVVRQPCEYHRRRGRVFRHTRPHRRIIIAGKTSEDIGRSRRVTRNTNTHLHINVVRQKNEYFGGCGRVSRNICLRRPTTNT